MSDIHSELEKFNTIIFDMDGVISDTQSIHSQREREILLRYGIDISAEEITKRFAGMSSKDFWRIIFEEYNQENIDIQSIILEKREMMKKALSKGVPSISGVVELIKKVYSEGKVLGVASASSLEMIQIVLDGLEISGCFKAITSAHEVKRGKPFPDIFLLAAERLLSDPEQCLVIEDSFHGMTAAKAAGMKCLGYVQDSRCYPADWIVHDFFTLL